MYYMYFCFHTQRNSCPEHCIGKNRCVGKQQETTLEGRDRGMFVGYCVYISNHQSGTM